MTTKRIRRLHFRLQNTRFGYISVGFDRPPLPTVIADVLALRADREHAFEPFDAVHRRLELFVGCRRVLLERSGDERLISVAKRVVAEIDGAKDALRRPGVERDTDATRRFLREARSKAEPEVEMLQ